MQIDKPIAFGRRSKIYDIGNNKILKLYDENFPEEKIYQEFEKNKLIKQSTSLLIPTSYELINFKKQKGIIYEKIEGICLMDLFQKNPINYFTYGKTITTIHKKIHQLNVISLPTQEVVFVNIINNSNRLTSKEKKVILKILFQKYTPTLCHGDFHHGNIILTKNYEYYIFDWMDAFQGNYLLDICLTAVNAIVSDAPKHIPYFFRIAYELIKNIFTLDKRYLHLYGIDNYQLVNGYLLLAAGIHLVRAPNNWQEHRKYFDKIFKKKSGRQFFYDQRQCDILPN